MSPIVSAPMASAPITARATLATAAAALVLAACSSQGAQTFPSQAPETLQPVATIQELMQAEVDASADDIWDAVETTTSSKGEATKQPRTAQEWQEVRRDTIVLIEAAKLLTVRERKLSSRPFPAEAAGALDSGEIARRIATNRSAFNHMTFWYPNQVIPAFPSKGDPRYQAIAVNPSR